MRIFLILPLALNIIGLLSGADAQENTLSCLNDYVVTVRCVLNISFDHVQPENVTYWLEFERNDDEKFDCSLVKVMDHYNCTFESTEQFIDLEQFVIRLCSKTNGNTDCLILDNNYMPKNNIKPITPSSFKVHWSSGYYKFSWDNGYERYSPPNYLIRHLKYHLQYYKRGHPDNALEIHPHNTTQYIDAIKFEPDTEYITKVRSSPDQIYYKGQWSEWSPAVQWRTNASQDAAHPVNADVVLFIGSLALPVCVLAGLLLYLCFISPTIRLRIKQYSEVPTPAPYFQPLYSNYNGDFQSWLVSSGNLGEPFKNEEILKIDSLIEATPISNEDSFFSPLYYQTQCQPAYVNPCGDACAMTKEGSLHSVLPVSIQSSKFNIHSSLSLDHAGPKGDDSGCEDPVRSLDSSWPCNAVSSFEPESMSYSEDYCTLSETHNDLIPTNGVE